MLWKLLDQHDMETRTPVTYIKGSSRSSNSVKGRHGCVVLCNSNDVQIKLGSSSNLAVHPPHSERHHPPHQLQQQADADAGQEPSTRATDETHHRASHVQPSAPGQQTLHRPWPARTTTTSTNEHGEDGGQNRSVETIRPPPFNPNSSDSTHAESLPPDAKSSQAALDDQQLFSDGSTASAAADSRNAMPPPSYDDIYGCQKDQHYNQQQMSSVTVTTADESASCPSSLPCVAKFGHYADTSAHPQPGWFSHPTRISVRVDQSDQSEGTTVMVIDQGSSTVQVFTSNGDCLSLLSVPRVSGGCFVGNYWPPLLLLAVGTSVSVYEMDGRLVKEIPLTGRQQDAAVLTTVAYGDRGFVAVRSQSLSICRGGITRPAVVHTLAGRYRVDRGTTPFVNVVDVAVDWRRGRLIVLDGANPSVSRHRAAVYVMTEDGAVLQAIRPAHDPRCGPLLHPFAVVVDRAANLLVSDAGRVLQFSGDDGRYVATLIGDDSSESGQPGSTRVHGIAVSSTEQERVVFAVLTGDRFAQIRAFSL